jgi:hypothetical protein
MPCDYAEDMPVCFDWFLIVTYFDHIVPSMGQNLKIEIEMWKILLNKQNDIGQFKDC